MSHYSRNIAEAINQADPDTLALVEDLMRQETGGVLDHLSLADLRRHAREAYTDAQWWNAAGTAYGHTLSDYCRASGITPPEWVK